MEPSQRGLPTWVVIMTAIVTPILLGVLFTMAMDAGRLPESERLRDPNAGYTQAYTDEAIVFVYIVADIVFLFVAPLLMTGRPSFRFAVWATPFPFSWYLSLFRTFGQWDGSRRGI